MLNPRPIPRTRLPWLAAPTLIAALLLPGWLSAQSVAGDGSSDPPSSACSAAEDSHSLPAQIELPESLAGLRDLNLRGRCALANGDLHEAARLFSEGFREAPELARVWGFNLMRVALRADWPEQGAALLTGLLKEDAPGNRRLIRGLLLRELDSGSGTGGAPASLVPYLRTYLVAVTPHRDDHRLADGLYRALAADGPAGAANPEELDQLEMLLWSIPANQTTARAWGGVIARGREQGRHPSAEATLRRLRNLRRLRLYNLIRTEFHPSQLPSMSPETAREAGRAYFTAMGRKKAYSEALAQLEQSHLLDRFHFEERHVLSITVGLLLRAKRLDEAERVLTRLELLDETDITLPGFYLDLARRARAAGHPEAMSQWCRRLIRAFPDHPKVSDAYWMLVWHHYRKGEHGQAGHWADTALENGIHPSDVPRFLYWLARIRAMQGKPRQAEQALDSLLADYPLHYYGLLAKDSSLENPAPIPDPERLSRHSGPVAPPRLSAVWEEPSLRAALLLYFLDEQELGDAALYELLGETFPEPALREAAEALLYFGSYHMLQTFSGRYFAKAVRAGEAVDEALPRYVFPLAYWDQVWSAASKRGVNPFFVMAVMREESHFRVDADSSAGARGLMQLMPGTAAMVARWNRKRLDLDSLLDPDANISMGVQYMEWLWGKFKGHPVYIAAGYNAGPGAVKRWLKARRNLPIDEFIEEIPFNETKNYVKKVLRSTIMYARLYGATENALPEEANSPDDPADGS